MTSIPTVDFQQLELSSSKSTPNNYKEIHRKKKK